MAGGPKAKMKHSKNEKRDMVPIDDRERMGQT